jgi:hypothetical protein
VRVIEFGANVEGATVLAEVRRMPQLLAAHRLKTADIDERLVHRSWRRLVYGQPAPSMGSSRPRRPARILSRLHTDLGDVVITNIRPRFRQTCGGSVASYRAMHSTAEQSYREDGRDPRW